VTALLHSPAGEYITSSVSIESIVALDPRNRMTADWTVVISTDESKYEVFSHKDGAVANDFVDELKAAIADRPGVIRSAATFDLDAFAARFALARMTGANL